MSGRLHVAPPEGPEPARTFATRSGAFVGTVNLAAQLADRILSFAQIVLIAAFFGVSRNADLYFLATIVPLLIASTIGEPIGRAVVTQLVRTDDERSARLAGAGAMNTLALFSVLTVVYLAVALPIVHAVAPDQSSALEPWIVFALITPPMGLAAYLASILLWSEQYVWAAARAPLSTLAGTVLLVIAVEFTHRLVWVAAALTGGYAIATVILCVVVGRRLGRGWLLHSGRDAGLSARSLSGKIAAPVIGGALSGQVIVLIERALAASVQPGAVSLISYSRGIAGAPTTVSLALGAAAYPRLARAEAAGSTTYLRDNFVRGLRVALFSGTAFAAFFAIYAHNLVGSLLQRGQFGFGDAESTAHLLALFALSTFTGSLLFYLVNVLYGIDAFAGILWLEASVFVVYVATAVVLRHVFGLGGLAFAFGVGQFVGIATGIVLISSRLALGARAFFRTAVVPLLPRLVVLVGILFAYKEIAQAVGVSVPAKGIVYVGGATVLLLILLPALLLSSRLPESVALRAAARRLVARAVS